MPGLRSLSTLNRRASHGRWPRPARDTAVPLLARRVGMATSAALVIYFPPVALPITGNGRVARLSLVKRSALGTARRKALGKNGFVHISQCSFEFRLGAGIIGSSKNRSNPMQIINFDLAPALPSRSDILSYLLKHHHITNGRLHNRPSLTI